MQMVADYSENNGTRTRVSSIHYAIPVGVCGGGAEVEHSGDEVKDPQILYMRERGGRKDGGHQTCSQGLVPGTHTNPLRQERGRSNVPRVSCTTNLDEIQLRLFLINLQRVKIKPKESSRVLNLRGGWWERGLLRG